VRAPNPTPFPEPDYLLPARRALSGKPGRQTQKFFAMTLRIALPGSRLSDSRLSRLRLSDPRLADPQPAVRPRRRLRAALRPARLPFPDAAAARAGKRQQNGRPRSAVPPPTPRPRTDLPDPQWALARVRMLRGQRVLLERDLASALGTLSGRLADLALRHPEWFPVQARFALSPQECEQQGLWFTRPDLAPAGFAARWRDYPPAAPVAYTADGLVAAAHWLEAEAVRAGDPYAETTDLAARFRLAWQALQP
jgi:hypothetical protein